MDKDIKKIILNILPKDVTEAIYIFGSYGTEFFDKENSDIDIAWFVNKNISYEELSSYEFELCEELGKEVDLVIPQKDNIYFLKEVLSREPLIINSDEFVEWLDRFNDWVLDEYNFIRNVIDERCGKYE